MKEGGREGGGGIPGILWMEEEREGPPGESRRQGTPPHPPGPTPPPPPTPRENLSLETTKYEIKLKSSRPVIRQESTQSTGHRKGPSPRAYWEKLF